MTTGRGRGFSIIELMVALLIAAVGVGGILQTFVQISRTGSRDAVRAQAMALGRGLIAEWQAMARSEVAARLAQGRGVWPPRPQEFDAPGGDTASFSWQWRWQGDLPAQGPLALTLYISSSRDASGEAVRLPATL